MNFFEDVKDRINDLAKSYSQNTDGNEYGDEYFNVSYVSDTSIEISEYLDGNCREYTETDPAVINKDWIRDRIIITDSAIELDLHVDPEIMAEWISDSVDATILMTLDHIIITNNSEEDYDFLSMMDDRYAYMLECSDLPGEETAGLMWYNYQMVFVNMGTLVSSADEMVADGLLYEWERNSEINEWVATTVAHEIRHLAQANPFMREDILQQVGDDEADAEEYALRICDRGVPWMLNADGRIFSGTITDSSHWIDEPEI